MIQKKKTEGEAGCCVHGSRIRKPVQPPILYFMSESEPLGGLGKPRNVKKILQVWWKASTCHWGPEHSCLVVS